MNNRIEKLKEIMGIDSANCDTCTHFGSDGDGPEYNGSWPVCDKDLPKTFLKSFPFKKEQECWEPNFWFSKFADAINDENSFEPAVDEFCKALSLAGEEGAESC